MQIDLAIHDVEWCRQGHPVLVLKEREGERKIALAISVEDAQDMFREGDRGSGRSRVCVLALALLDHLGATLDAVTLAVGEDDVLQARLRIDTPGRELLLTIHASDGLVLSQQRHLPLRIAAPEFARVAYTKGTTRTQQAPPPQAKQRAHPADPLAPFRAVVESLEFPEGNASR